MLETLANLGELIGALGVIVSIGYLAAPRIQRLLPERRGPLSARLADEVTRRTRELGLPSATPRGLACR